MMREIYFDPARHALPGSWDELSCVQLRRVAKALHAGGPGMEAAVLKAIMPAEGLWLLTEEQAGAALAFLVSGPRRRKALEPIRAGMRLMHGPADGMSNSRFGEFVTAEAAFRSFASGGDAGRLDRLCAALFRPEPWPWQARQAGDRRRPFDSNRVEEDAKAWRKVPMPEKLAVAAFFAGCLEGFAKSFPRIFRRPEQGHVPDKAVWLKAVQRLAGGLQNYDPVMESRATLVFFEISQRIEEAERIRKQLEK
jgi:hypothetical protein